MNNDKIFEFLLELTQESAMELIKIYRQRSDTTTQLVFPKERNGNCRICEQEFRVTLTNMLEKHAPSGISYSVETPTDGLYSFSSIGKRSASSDLSLYYDGKKVINIEFKSHIPRDDTIQKDLEKLTKEPYCGAWLQILQNEDKGTIERLFSKFCSSISNLKCEIQYPISFHILILKTGILLSRKGKDTDIGNFNATIFNIKHSSWKDLVHGKHFFKEGVPIDKIGIDHNEDWQIDKFDL